MRRSSSFSNLPVPVYKLERSKSASRISREPRPSISNRTPIRRPMVSLASVPVSASSTKSVNRLSNLKRPSLVIATPQSAKGKCPNKLGNTSEQYLKVRTFLQEHLHCDEKILNNLKPLAISNFVEIIKILLHELKMTVEINTANYKEVVISTLKMLNYPGTVSTSIMKTVNTMHSWPHVINIFSWMIDLIFEINMCTSTFEKRQGLTESVLDNMATRFNLFNEGQYDENADKLDEEFLKNLNKGLNIDDRALNDLRMKTKQLREQNDNLNRKFDGYAQDVALFQNQLQQLETELQINDGDNIDTDAHIEISEANIERLEAQINNQPFCIKEMNAVSEDIDNLKHTKGLKEAKFQQWLKIRDEYDCQLVNLKKNIETKIYQWNSTLMPFKIKYPKCEAFMLNENAIPSKDFISQVKQCCQNQEIISAQMIEDIKIVKSNIEDLKGEIDEMKHVFLQTRKELDELNEKEEQLLNDIRVQENKNYVETQNFIKKTQQLQDIITEMIDDISVDDLQEQLEKLEKQKLQSQISLDEDGANALICFQKHHKHLVKFANECVKIRNNIVGKLAETSSRINCIQDDMLDELKMLEPFRKTN